MPEKVTAIELKCTICNAVVTPETYAAHVQQAHTRPQDQNTAPQTTAARPGNAWDSWNATQGAGPGFRPVVGPIASKNLSGGHYLKGADVPRDVAEVRFKLIQFVIDPQGKSKLAAQITETYGKTMFGLNVTNIRILALMGYDDLQKLAGKTLVCKVGFQPNPQQSGLPTPSLFVAAVED